MAMTWRTDPSAKGLQVAHQPRCPLHGVHLSSPEARRKRCAKDCTPRYRRRLPAGPDGKAGYSPTTTDRATAIGHGTVSANAAAARRADAAAGIAPPSRTLGDVAHEWWRLAKSGRLGRRRGASAPYSHTTLNVWDTLLHNHILPKWEDRPGDTISAREWQAWIDELAARPLSHSRIVEHLAVVRAVYAYALRPSRAIWQMPADPTKGCELPPNVPVRPRMRVIPVPEARRLLAALPDDLRIGYAIAVFAGLRRSEIERLEWPEVLWQQKAVTVGKSKSDAGTNRTVPVFPGGIEALEYEWQRQGRPSEGRVLTRSISSGKWQAGADDAWTEANEKRVRAWEDAGNVEPISPSALLQRWTLHEGRHTYASMLVAAGTDLAHCKEYMGHADLQAFARYLKRLPQPGGKVVAPHLAAYEERWNDAA